MRSDTKAKIEIINKITHTILDLVPDTDSDIILVMQDILTKVRLKRLIWLNCLISDPSIIGCSASAILMLKHDLKVCNSLAPKSTSALLQATTGTLYRLMKPRFIQSRYDGVISSGFIKLWFNEVDWIFVFLGFEDLGVLALIFEKLIVNYESQCVTDYMAVVKI